MEERRGCRHGTRPPPLPPPSWERRQASRGSFSASLLDAVYRSLDDGDGAEVVDAARWSEEKATAAAAAQFWWAKEAARQRKAAATAHGDRSRRETAGAARQRHSGYASSTTSSSTDSSCSYADFSCSSASTTDTDQSARRRSPPSPRMPEKSVAPDAQEAAAPPNGKGKKKSRPCLPMARLRTASSSPSSPRPLPASPASFAGVLKALFSPARLQRKPKTAPASTPRPDFSPAPPQPTCMSVPRAAKVVDALEHPERRTVSVLPGADASVVRRRVEELVRSLEELEEDVEGSDSSSDLFELESLHGAGGNELPVYGTTSLAANHAIAREAAC